MSSSYGRSGTPGARGPEDRGRGRYPAGPEPSRGGIPDGAIVGLLATLLGATALVWFSTALGALVTHGRLPHPLPFGGTPEAIRSLALNPNGLGAAWPGTPAPELPSPMAFWVTFFLLLAGLISLALTILTAWMRIRAARHDADQPQRAREAPTPAAPTASAEDSPIGQSAAAQAGAGHSAPGKPALGKHGAEQRVAGQSPGWEQPSPTVPFTTVNAETGPPATGPLDTDPLDTGLLGTGLLGTPVRVPAPAVPAPFAFPAGMTALLVPDPAAAATRRQLLRRAIETATGPVLVVTDDPALWESRPAHRDARLFDPLRLIDDVPDPETRVRWAPHDRCDDPATATTRARALLAPTARVSASPYQSQSERGVQETARTLLRCWLHAAALDGRPFRHVQRWASGSARGEALGILRTADPHQAAAGWDGELQALLTNATEVRDAALDRILGALDMLSEFQVLQACTPTSATDGLDPESVLRHRGTLYLLGRATESRVAAQAQRSAMPLLTALVEDVVERGRRVAVRSSSGRLDPPLLCVLDNVAAVAPFPGLPELMARGGPLGLHGVAVLRSPEQARSRWDANAVHSLWTNSDARAVLGPVHSPDLAALLGALDTAAPETEAAAAGGPLGEGEVLLLTSKLPAQRFRTAVPSASHPAPR